MVQVGQLLGNVHSGQGIKVLLSRHLKWKSNEAVVLRQAFFSQKTFFKRRHSKWHSIVQRCIKRFCLFVCLFTAAPAIFQLSGGCHHHYGCKFRPMHSTYGFCSEDSFTCHIYCSMGSQFIWTQPKLDESSTPRMHPHSAKVLKPCLIFSNFKGIAVKNHLTAI
jgi:hypothetical protein